MEVLNLLTTNNLIFFVGLLLMEGLNLLTMNQFLYFPPCQPQVPPILSSEPVCIRARCLYFNMLLCWNDIFLAVVTIVARLGFFFTHVHLFCPFSTSHLARKSEQHGPRGKLTLVPDTFS